MKLGDYTVTVLRPPDPDRHGGIDWSTAVPFTHPGCSVQPLGGRGQASGGEVTDLQDTVTDTRQLWDPDMDLEATDRVVYDGKTYEVQGEPQPWPFPPVSYVYALLRRVAG